MSTEEMIIQVREEVTRLQQEHFEVSEIVKSHCKNSCTVASCRNHMYYPCAKGNCDWYAIKKALGEAKDEKSTATA